MEGTHCPLARRGYSRRQEEQAPDRFGLLCSPEGCPVAVEVFEGNTSDPKTVACQVDKLRFRFGLARVVLVGDRGMLTSARIREDLAGVEGLRWITSLRAPAIRKLIADKTVHPSLFDQRDLAEVQSDDFPGERLIVCRNPRLAVERRRKRQELLAATEKLLEPIAAATRRERRPLRGKDEIGIASARSSTATRSPSTSKPASPTTPSPSHASRTSEAEEQLDGIYIIRSNVEPERLDADHTVRAYKSLSRVERAFRCLKSVDLKVRPIHHHRADRVRAHILLCMLAYYVEWHMRELAPLLFDDHDPEAAERCRSSVVQPAQRSPAGNKAARKRTHDDLPVHSFRSLLTAQHLHRQHHAHPRNTKHLHPTPRTYPRSETLALLRVSLLL